jgi:uncharacterized protein (DUF58 family)
MAGIADFLSPEAMRKLDALALRSRYVVEGGRAGQHRSPLKGASIEFSDYRPYVKGDNLRNLDWKVFGRTERYYIKQFEEETNLRVQILLDASASMGFAADGRPTKYRFACNVAAALGYIVAKHQDSLGLTVFDVAIREEVPARGGMRHLRLFLERLAAHEPSGKTDTGEALHVLAERTSRRGLIVLMTDLLDDPDAVFGAVAHFRKKMHDVILLQILDPAELELSVDRVAEFVDMETGERLELDPAVARKAYKEELSAFIEGVRERCGAMNVDYRLVSTGESFEDFVHQYLAERRRMSL